MANPSQARGTARQIEPLRLSEAPPVEYNIKHLEKIIGAEMDSMVFDLPNTCLQLGKILIQTAAGYVLNQLLTNHGTSDADPQSRVDPLIKFALINGCQELTRKILELAIKEPRKDVEFWRRVHGHVRRTIGDFVESLSPEERTPVNIIHDSIDRSLTALAKDLEPHTEPKTTTQIYEYLVVLLAGHLGKPRKMFNYLAAVDIATMEKMLGGLGEAALFFKVVVFSIIARSVAPEHSFEDTDKETIGLQVLITGDPGIGKTKIIKGIPEVIGIRPIDFNAEAKKESPFIREQSAFKFQSRPGQSDTATTESVLDDAIRHSGYLNTPVLVDELQAAAGVMNRDPRKHAQQKRLFDPSRGKDDPLRHTIVLATGNTPPKELDPAVRDRLLIIGLTAALPQSQILHRDNRREQWRAVETAQDASSDEEYHAPENNGRRIEIFHNSYDIARQFARDLEPDIARIPGTTNRLRNMVNDLMLHWQSVQCALYGPNSRVDKTEAINFIDQIIKWNCTNCPAPPPAPDK
jgi:hypothetical protein